MTQLPSNPNLELRLSNGAGESFYVHEFTLEEGLSRISRGELLLYSLESIDADALDEYLGINATVIVTQHRQGRVVQRWYSGIVSQVEHLGVIQENNEEATLGFRMVIEPSIVNLCHACHNYNLIDITPAEAVIGVLDDYAITYEMHLSEDNTPGLKTRTSFFQKGESDYEFLLKILSDYGISYNYVSAPCEDTPSVPVLHLFAATDYLPSSPLTSGSMPLPFHCRKRSDAVYPMTRWQMQGRLGVDNVRIDYQTAGGEQLHDHAGDTQSKRSLAFNHSPFGLLTSSSIQRISQNYLRALKLNQQTWRGETICIEATPGTYIQVLEFYGSSNADVIKALISTSKFFCRAPMPDAILFSLSPQLGTFTVDFTCVDGEQEKLFTTQSLKLQQNVLLPASNELPPQPHLQAQTASPVNFQQAIVCDKDGNVKDNCSIELQTDDSGDNHYCFVAKLMTATDKQPLIRVWMMMPLAGTNMGLFRIPRQGETILVARAGDGQDYYLMGYLPSAQMPFVSDINASREMNTNVKATRSLHSASIMRFDVTSDHGHTPYIGDGKNGISPYSHNGAIGESNNLSGNPDYAEIGFYSFCDNSADSDTALKDDLNMKSKYIKYEANNELSVDAKEVKFTKTVPEKGYDYSKENLDPDFLVEKFKEIDLEAKNSITFQVGQTKMVITPSQIVLMAARWSGITGTLASSIILSALTGVTISGMNTSIMGGLSCSMTDGAGASVGFSAGTMTASGAPVQLKTIPRYAFITSSVFTAAKWAEEVESYVIAFARQNDTSKDAKDKYGNKVFDEICGYVNRTVTVGFALMNTLASINALNKGGQKFYQANIFAKVCEFVATLMEQLELAFEVRFKDGLNKTVKGAVTRRDAINVSIATLLTTSWISALVATFKNSSGTAASEIKLTGKTVYVDSITFQKCSRNAEENNSVASGLL